MTEAKLRQLRALLQERLEEDAVGIPDDPFWDLPPNMQGIRSISIEELIDAVAPLPFQFPSRSQDAR